MEEKYPDFGPMAVDVFDTDLMSEKNLVTYKKTVEEQERQIKDG